MPVLQKAEHIIVTFQKRKMVERGESRAGRDGSVSWDGERRRAKQETTHSVSVVVKAVPRVGSLRKGRECSETV